MVDFRELDKKWNQIWEESKVFNVDVNSKKKKFYCLEMLPYPSGNLHMGHVKNYFLGDCLARYKRLKGFNVFYPIGFDSFGLPAENAAIKRKSHPKVFTEENINQMISQMKLLGLSYDWNNLIYTHKKEYYKWNQWFFLKFLEKGLAYRKKANTNFCLSCNTVLANEQVEDGKCWRCESDVTQKELAQWFFKTTNYASELYEETDKLEWPEKVKQMQKKWIGKSHGCEVNFKVEDCEGLEEFSVFTTRPDTIFGVSFIVLSQDSSFIENIISNSNKKEEFEKEIQKLKTNAKDLKRKEKNGFFSGKYAINPVNKKKIPIWIADYILVEYGTGVVMGVPAHDQRDFEFATKYKLDIIPTRETGADKLESAFLEEASTINSEEFDGKNSLDLKTEIIPWIEKKGFGKKTVNYKLKDWLISRQRYWGTPIPVVYCDKCGVVPVKEEDLPIVHPENVKFTGEGNALEKCSDFVNTTCPSCNGKARRETDTMDTFVDSSWYFLRYLSPNEDSAPFDKKVVNNFSPVDQYIGGIEHAILHLLYSRFFVKVLKNDLKLLKDDVPFKKLLCQGMILKDGVKMSKSKGNVVDPLQLLEENGSDVLREFILSVSAPTQDFEWNDEGIKGSNKILYKIFSLLSLDISTKRKETKEDKYILSKISLLNEKAKACLDVDCNDYSPNLLLFSLKEFIFNDFAKYVSRNPSKEVYDKCTDNLIVLLSCFTPHLSEELWNLKGKKELIVSTLLKDYEIEFKEDKEAEWFTELIYDVLPREIENVKNVAKLNSIKKIKFIVSKQYNYRLGKILYERRKSLSGKNDFSEEKDFVLDKLEKYKQDIPEIMNKLQFLRKKESQGLMVINLWGNLDLERFSSIRCETLKELEVEALNELKQKLELDGIKVDIEDGDSSSENKASKALPGKPAIILE